MLSAWVIVPGLAIFLGACAAPSPIDPKDPIELSGREGLLIVDIDSEVPIRLLRTNSIGLADIEQGRHVWMVRIKAGHYRWRALELEVGGGGRPWRYEIADDESFRFSVEPGVINYPGQLIIRRRRGLARVWPPALLFRTTNHSGMALRTLGRTHANILQEYSLVHSGPGGDLFLDYYSEMARRLRATEVGPEGDDP
jgi:hypothetical protein